MLQVTELCQHYTWVCTAGCERDRYPWQSGSNSNELNPSFASTSSKWIALGQSDFVSEYVTAPFAVFVGENVFEALINAVVKNAEGFFTTPSRRLSTKWARACIQGRQLVISVELSWMTSREIAPVQSANWACSHLSLHVLRRGF